MHRFARSPFRTRSALFAVAPTAGAAAFAASLEAPFLAENHATMAKMMAAVDVAPSGDVDADFVAMMVPHHQGAIDMAQAQLRYGRNEQLRRLAQDGGGALEPLAAFTTNPTGSAVVNAIGPIRQVVRGEADVQRHYLVIAPGTATTRVLQCRFRRKVMPRRLRRRSERRLGSVRSRGCLPHVRRSRGARTLPGARGRS